MAHYSQLPQFENVEIQRAPESNGAIRSITITKETKPDGSIVRRKETLLESGKMLVEEYVISGGPQSSGLRFLPAPAVYTAPAEILPLFHRPPPPPSKQISESNDRYPTWCKLSGCILLLLILLQVFLLFMLRSGKDFDSIAVSFRDFWGHTLS